MTRVTKLFPVFTVMDLDEARARDFRVVDPSGNRIGFGAPL